MSIGTLYYTHSTARGQANFKSMPFHSASITHNRDKASMMTFKSTVKLAEADRIIYKDTKNKKTFGGQVVKRSKGLGEDYSYEVMDYTRLYQTKVSCSFAKKTSSQILKQLIKWDKNNLSTSGIKDTTYVHAYLKWDNTSLWEIIEQLAWLEYKAGNHIYYDVDYRGNLIWKKIPQKDTGYKFTEAYDYEESHDSSSIITQGVLVNSKNFNQHADAFASKSIIAKWGYVAEVATCNPPSSNKSSTSNKKKDCKKKTKDQFWTKCGLSPDGKLIVSVAKPSSGDHARYAYRLYRTVFTNYCPNCHRKGYLRFDGGRKTKCITSSTYGHPWKDDVQAEHEITCIACDSDYCGVTGQEKSYGHISRLKTVKKPVKSSQKEYNKLTSGKLVYQKGTTGKCDSKNNTKGTLKNDKNIQKYHIASSVWKKAVELTDPKKSEMKNAKAIFKWMDDHLPYESYGNTRYGAAGTLKRGRGNCCDHAHLFAAMCRAVGIKCNYIHNHCCGKSGHVYNKVYINGKGIIVDTGRDNASWGSHWGNAGCPVEKTSIDF